MSAEIEREIQRALASKALLYATAAKLRESLRSIELNRDHVIELLGDTLQSIELNRDHVIELRRMQAGCRQAIPRVPPAAEDFGVPPAAEDFGAEPVF